MIRIENTEVMGWEAAIRGMRNPMNSWNKSDSYENYSVDYEKNEKTEEIVEVRFPYYRVGAGDLALMEKLAAAGPVHAKYRRMITVYCDITAPLYWWKEFDTYKVGTVANSCSTMHKIADKEFTLEDFSCEHLIDEDNRWVEDEKGQKWCSAHTHMETTINLLNAYRYQYLETKDKKYWWHMIQLLPSSYNQKRTVMLNYEVLSHIYHDRRNHKLDEWCRHTESTCAMDAVGECLNGKEYLLCEDCSAGKGFCDWIETLPYSELIIGEEASNE